MVEVIFFFFSFEMMSFCVWFPQTPYAPVMVLPAHQFLLWHWRWNPELPVS